MPAQSHLFGEAFFGRYSELKGGKSKQPAVSLLLKKDCIAMRISIIQNTLHWEQPGLNRSLFAEKIATVVGQTDLIVLPEMFTSGFSMSAEALAENMQGPTMQWLRDMSKLADAAIAGSFICEDDGFFFNRLVFMRPDGSYDFYDKKHLFSLGGESDYYQSGQKRIIVEWRGWHFCPLICYDLRFPAWSRNTSGSFVGGHNPYYDVLIYVANWPARRAQHWRSLLTARAIENQAFVVGVNAVGQDGDSHPYCGDSVIINYTGETLVHISAKEEEIQTVVLSREGLMKFRNELPFLKDGDAFTFAR